MYLVFLVATTPAQWASFALAYATQGLLHLDAVSGTLWRGNGHLSINKANAVPLSLGEGEWRVNPLWLVVGRVAARLNFRNSHARTQGEIVLGYQRATFQNIRISFPASLLQTLYTPVAFIGPSGEMQLTAATFAISNKKVTGNAMLNWKHAGSTLSSVTPLGDYQLGFEGDGNDLKVSLKTLDGSLALAGQGGWSRETTKLAFQGTAQATARAAEMEPLLKLLGRDQGEGKRTFVLNMSLGS